MSTKSTLKSALSYSYRWFLSYDMYGPAPQLLFKGKPTYSTFFGLIMTLTSIFITIYMIKFQIISFFTATNPDTYYSRSFDNETSQIDYTNFKFYIEIQHVNISTGKAVHIDKSKIEYPSYYTTLKNSSGYFRGDSISMVDCGDKVFGNYNDGFFQDNTYSNKSIEYKKKNSYCFPENFNRSLSSNRLSKEIVNIAFPRSYLALIKEFYYIQVRLTYQTVFINTEDYRKTYNKIWKSSNFYLSEDNLQVLDFGVFNHCVKKDWSVFIFTGEENECLIDMDKVILKNSIPLIKSNFSDNADFSFISTIKIFKHDLAENILIKYVSIYDILDSFGGTFEAIRIIFSYLHVTIISKFIFPSVINRVFNLYSQDKSTLWHKRYAKQEFFKGTKNYYDSADIVRTIKTLKTMKTKNKDNNLNKNNNIENPKESANISNDDDSANINDSCNISNSDKENNQECNQESNQESNQENNQENNQEIKIESKGNEKSKSSSFMLNKPVSNSSINIDSSPVSDPNHYLSSANNHIELEDINMKPVTNPSILNKPTPKRRNSIFSSENVKNIIHEDKYKYRKDRINVYEYVCALKLNTSSLRSKMIRKLKDLVDECTDIGSVIKTGLEFGILKDALARKEFKFMFNYPRISFNDVDSLKLLEQMNLLAQNDEEPKSVLKILEGIEDEVDDSFERKLIYHYLRYY